MPFQALELAQRARQIGQLLLLELGHRRPQLFLRRQQQLVQMLGGGADQPRVNGGKHVHQAIFQRGLFARQRGAAGGAHLRHHAQQALLEERLLRRKMQVQALA